MAAELHWIALDAKGRLATMARPNGGFRLKLGLRRLATQGVTGLVSLLSDGEVQSVGLTKEGAACAELGLTFRHLPLPDFGVPSDEAAYWSLAREVHAEIAGGSVIAIHCHAGIGRSSLLAAAVLTLAGHPASEVFDTISTARGVPVPDAEGQRAWFEESASRVNACS